MKKAFIIGGAVVIAIVAAKYLSGGSTFYQPQQNNMPKNYLDSYWQNLKGTFGRIF